MRFLTSYRLSNGTHGSNGYFEFDRPKDALRLLREKNPTAIALCAHTVTSDLCTEDLPIGPAWNLGGDRLSTTDIHPGLPEAFLAWSLDTGHVEHTPDQQALKSLRKQVIDWATEGGAALPGGTWLGVYRCATKDWDWQSTLTKVRLEKKEQFMSFVTAANRITGDRVLPEHPVWSDLLGWIEFHETRAEADEECDGLNEYLSGIHIIHRGHVIKSASKDYPWNVVVPRIVSSVLVPECVELHRQNEYLG